MTTSPKTALLILGMHRSGTSLLTRILSLLGADLPANLAPPNDGNQAGYWESLDHNALHEEIFNALSLSWDSLANLPLNWHQSSHAAPFRKKILTLLHRDFPASNLFVLKDPRLSRLVPLWIQALNEFGARPLFIIALRNPLEVAASLERLYPILPQKAMLLWLRYMLDAERDTRLFPRAFISYDDLLTDWPAAIARLTRAANIHWPRTPQQASPEITAHLSSRLRHYRSALSTLESDSTILWWVKALYAALLSATRDTPANSLTDDIRPLCDHLQKLFDDAHLIYAPILTQLTLENTQLKQDAAKTSLTN